MRRIAPDTRARARRLRKDFTDAESALWNLFRGRQLLGYKFCRQVPVGRYFADFACLEQRLIIESDGSQHQEQTDYDASRTRWLEAQGFMVIRFWNSEVLGNPEGVQQAILTALKEAT